MGDLVRNAEFGVEVLADLGDLGQRALHEPIGTLREIGKGLEKLAQGRSKIELHQKLSALGALRNHRQWTVIAAVLHAVHNIVQEVVDVDSHTPPSIGLEVDEDALNSASPHPDSALLRRAVPGIQGTSTPLEPESSVH